MRLGRRGQSPALSRRRLGGRPNSAIAWLRPAGLPAQSCVSSDGAGGNKIEPRWPGGPILLVGRQNSKQERYLGFQVEVPRRRQPRNGETAFALMCRPLRGLGWFYACTHGAPRAMALSSAFADLRSRVEQALFISFLFVRLSLSHPWRERRYRSPSERAISKAF